MERDFGKEIDELREEIRVMKLCGSSRGKADRSDMGSLMRFWGKSLNEIEKGKRIPEWGLEHAREALEKGYDDGIVKYGGIFRSPANEGYMWNLECDARELLELDESVVEKVLSAMGNRMRLRILKTVLRAPSTANELVEQLGLNTTGQAYHHLNLLENADLIGKDGEGRYHFRGHRVSGFFAALLSVRNTLDDRYTTGRIDELPLTGED